MPLPSFDDLFARMDRSAPAAPVVAAGGADITVLQALSQATARGWVRPILAGERLAIVQAADAAEVDLTKFQIVDTNDDPGSAAVALIRSGEARFLMKGQISTPQLMKAVLDRDFGLRTGRPLCQVVLMEIPRDAKRFLLTDTGIIPAPTLDQKRELTRTLIDVASGLGCETPHIAVMSATEKVNPSLPDTLEAEQLVAAGTAGEFGDCVISGPLSFDLAYSPVAGQRKGVDGQTAGVADAMLFPDLTSANLTVKAIMYTADCRFGGVLRNAACPIVFMSRADDPATRLHSLALTVSLERSKPPHHQN
jgi:phosphate butyryltransferase